MCGRYFRHRDPVEFVRAFGAAPPTPNHPPTWNMAPTQAGLVLRRNPQTATRHLDVLRWGLVPRWAKDAGGAARLINARAETVLDKPSFRGAFRQRRCIVPMDGFYEWAQEVKPKQPFAVALRNGAPMAVAGLWEGWQDAEGHWLRSYCVITCAAAGRQLDLHPRMPVILPAAVWAGWLGEESMEELALTQLLRPARDDSLAFWPVGAQVGRVSVDTPALLHPLTEGLSEKWDKLREPPPDCAEVAR